MRPRARLVLAFICLLLSVACSSAIPQTKEEAIRIAAEYEPPAGVLCTQAPVDAIHPPTGARYGFMTGCLAPGWVSEREYLASSPTPSASPMGGSAPSNMSRPRAITGGGLRFGECADSCIRELQIGGAGDVHVLITDGGDSQARTQSGALTAEGWAELLAIEGALAQPESLTFGCPDCTDGGAAWLDLWSASSGDVTVTYEFGRPTEQLTAADAFVQEAISGLMKCEATEWIAPSDGCDPIVLAP